MSNRCHQPSNVFPEARDPLLHAAIGPVADTQSILQDIVEGMPGQVAVVDADWIIVAANSAWLASASHPLYGPRLRIGQDYRRFREWSVGVGFVEAKRLLDGIEAIDAGHSDRFLHTFVSSLDSTKHFRVAIQRFEIAGAAYASVSRFDLSELVKLRRERLRFRASLLQTRDDERHRIARELHDAASQFLVAMELGLVRLRQTRERSAAVEISMELNDLLDQFHREMRATTYLLHPPELEGVGLPAAVQFLSEGFARRTGLTIDLHIYGDGWDASPDVDAAVYRIVQEALSNVHKHARATRVRVRLVARETKLLLVVQDNGIGLCQPLDHGGLEVSALGVGIPGMMARVADLGGRLSVRSLPGRPGTTVAAAVPSNADSTRVTMAARESGLRPR